MFMSGPWLVVIEAAGIHQCWCLLTCLFGCVFVRLRVCSVVFVRLCVCSPVCLFARVFVRLCVIYLCVFYVPF